LLKCRGACSGDLYFRRVKYPEAWFGLVAW
jgi:hypothetical protein